MRRNPLFILSFVSFLLSPTIHAADPGSLEHLRDQWSQTVSSLKAFSAEQRDEALASADRSIKLLDRQIEALENEAREGWQDLGEEARAKQRQSLDALRRQRNQLSEWVGSMKSGSRNAWEDSKQGFISTYNKAASSLQQGIEAMKIDKD